MHSVAVNGKTVASSMTLSQACECFCKEFHRNMKFKAVDLIHHVRVIRPDLNGNRHEETVGKVLLSVKGTPKRNNVVNI